MNQVEKYQKKISEIFNKEINFKSLNIKNNCIGALASENDFKIFRDNFYQRIERLKAKFTSEEELNSIINILKNIGMVEGYKWSGAYSELIALDYWSFFKDIEEIKFPIKDSDNIFSNSIARLEGQTEVDLDLSLKIKHQIVFLDVKSFIPTHFELIDQIITLLKKKVTTNIMIGVNNLSEVNYLKIKSDLTNEIRGRKLIDKLEDAVKNKKKSLIFRLKSGNDIEFRVSYPDDNDRVLITTRSVNNYQLADEYKFKFLNYYNKLLLNKPSLLNLVINPWFNRDFIGDSKEDNLIFLRSLSRRVFVELTKDKTPMKSYFPKFKGNHTVSDISKKISGLVFINDKSILKEKEIYESYIFLNPNSDNVKLDSSNFDSLFWSSNDNKSNIYIDDFSYDNY